MNSNRLITEGDILDLGVLWKKDSLKSLKSNKTFTSYVSGLGGRTNDMVLYYNDVFLLLYFSHQTIAHYSKPVVKKIFN